MIHFHNAVRKSGVDTRRLKSVAKTLLREVNQAGSALSISLVGDREIQDLNREHRGKDKPTDVLSFPLYENPGDHLRHGDHPRHGEPVEPHHPERLLGDVVISIDTARRQAADYDAPLQDEIYRLLIHGILHVLGHDHEEPAERAAMEAEERRLAAAIGMPWPYD